MSCTIEEIVKHSDYDPDGVQRVSFRKVPLPLHIVPPNPSWPAHFEQIKSLIVQALGPTALKISHVGSTSVPHLPAKDVIDIDLTVPDPRVEADYVAALEPAGFQLLVREPNWWEHRCFIMSEPYHCNLHVFRPGAGELVRHLLMKERLTENQADRELYAQTKMEAMQVSVAKSESMQEYNFRKEKVIREILDRAFRAKGYLPQVEN